MFRKQTFMVGVIAALLGVAMMTLVACGAAAKQVKPDDADGGESAESQPSN
jgi:hypothetical protein